MEMFSCFSLIFPGKKKESKESKKALYLKIGEANVRPQVKLIDHLFESEKNSIIKEAAFDSLPPKPKHTSNGNLTQAYSGVSDVAYDGGDEHDEIQSLKRDDSDFDLQARANSIGSNHEFIQLGYELIENKSYRNDTVTPEPPIQSGHVSDPGMARKTTLSGSPVLKRSCSNIERTRSNMQTIHSPTKSQSYTDLKNLSSDRNFHYGIQSSPLSVKSNCSADRVMLKKRSSSQVLPSRSRKVWWKLFLWSHRNLHKPPAFSRPPIPPSASHHKAGYSSDTLEPTQTLEMRKKKAVEESGNQWVAFAMDSSSPFDRVDSWVNSIEENGFGPVHDAYSDGEGMEENNGGFVRSISQEIGESSGKNHSSHGGHRTTEEIMQANRVIQSLNSLSSVAHISGMGLKVVPSISPFSGLRSINLSGNYIVQINSGSLPKSLHTLDLSRNKITTIEGLRELTRLRVLNLSYNRIARIGHGLSNCTLIKELYLAGNKISDVEGLHRLLKLTVLDLSFNKITTSKALGQLVANYHSLLALNLIGNPIQANFGDDQLRKAVSSLLPHLTYLNKQPIKSQRAREAATDSVAKAALGSGRTGRRRVVRQASQVVRQASQVGSGIGSLTRRASQSPGVGPMSGLRKGSQNGSRGRHLHSTTSSRK